MRKVLTIVLAALAALALAIPAFAQGAPDVTSEDIVNQTIRTVDIGPGGVGKSEIRTGGVASPEVNNQSLRSWDLAASSVGWSELSDPVTEAINESLSSYVDGPYPGEGGSLQDLTDDGRAEYGTQWTDDDTLQQSIVRCADGYVAIGGGFGKNTEANLQNLQIVGSFPAGIGDDGSVVSESGGYIGSEFDSGPPTNSTVGQNGWVVEGYLNGGADITVRPYVVCVAE